MLQLDMRGSVLAFFQSSEGLPFGPTIGGLGSPRPETGLEHGYYPSCEWPISISQKCSEKSNLCPASVYILFFLHIVRKCICVCVLICNYGYIYIYIYTHLYIYIYIPVSKETKKGRSDRDTSLSCPSFHVQVRHFMVLKIPVVQNLMED